MFETKGKYQNPNSYFRIIFEICGQKNSFPQCHGGNETSCPISMFPNSS